jgi:hypothetical protein
MLALYIPLTAFILSIIFFLIFIDYSVLRINTLNN